jgi:hypothetical protein
VMNVNSLKYWCRLKELGYGDLLPGANRGGSKHHHSLAAITQRDTHKCIYLPTRYKPETTHSDQPTTHLPSARVERSE